MKKKLLLLFAVAILVVSCNPRENIVTFYLDNEISKQLVLNASVGDLGSSFVFSEKDLDLLESETFKTYFENIVELEVTSINITISGYDQSIANPIIKIGNSITIQNIPIINGSFKIQDVQLLNNISNELLSHQIVPFSFEGQSTAQDSFNVSVQVSLKGVFTD